MADDRVGAAAGGACGCWYDGGGWEACCCSRSLMRWSWSACICACSSWLLALLLPAMYAPPPTTAARSSGRLLLNIIASLLSQAWATRHPGGKDRELP